MTGDEEYIRKGWISSIAYYLFLILVFSLCLPQLPFNFLGYEILITEVLFLITGAFWLLSILLRQGRITWLGFYWALAGYLIAMLISALFSVDPKFSLYRFPEEGYLLCLTVLTVNILYSDTRLKQTILASLLGTSIAILVGLATIGLFYVDPGASLLEYLTYHYGSVPVGNFPRITAGFVSASMFCNYLNTSFVFAWLAGSRGWLSRRVSTGAIPAVILAAAFTFSLGLGGIALAIGLYSWHVTELQKPIKITLKSAGCLVSLFFLVISLFALAPYPGGRVLATIPLLNLNLMPSARLLVWNEAIQTFLSHPLTGVGLGKPVANVIFTNTGGDLSVLTDAHNSFLSVAAQNGIIGLATFIFLTYTVMRRWWVSIRSQSPTILTGLGIAFFCSFVYQGLTGSFEDARHLWILIGMFWAADRVEHQSI